MLKRNFILSILVLIISVTFLTYNPPAEVEISENNNESVELSSIRNITSVHENLSGESFIIVNLWASWCIPCIEEVDELKKISNDSRFYVIGLLVDDSMENGKEFIKEYDIEYENQLNQDDVEVILTEFKWSGIPTSVVLDLDYVIIKTFNGPITYAMINDISK
ncbi:TlpA family protein disulfide reductase [Candidatus Actinomarina sp.]|jgi:thiol-disulfide isomerase/thioredoxin|nr:TlpA family protein disulfide reductase [Candidatus Actinomarina sp.]MDA9607648.1 TlpA family protein disulfide reductase [Candidatus Actinomarina sp.]MDA9630209.1 TlpA family protein disulfide reductase [bacterium]